MFPDVFHCPGYPVSNNPAEGLFFFCITVFLGNGVICSVLSPKIDLNLMYLFFFVSKYKNTSKKTAD
jgi:hypothetical protein